MTYEINTVVMLERFPAERKQEYERLLQPQSH